MELHPRGYYQQTCMPQLHLQPVSSKEARGTLHAMDACWGTADGVTVLVTWRSGLYAHEIDLLSSAASYIHQVHHLMGYFSVFLTLWLGMSKIKQAHNGEFCVLDVSLSWIPRTQLHTKNYFSKGACFLRSVQHGYAPGLHSSIYESSTAGRRGGGGRGESVTLLSCHWHLYPFKPDKRHG